MEKQEFQLDAYLSKGVENIVKSAIRSTLTDSKESAFFVKFAAACREASRKRAKAEQEGEHIPPFLIASITSECNLHCVGCYAWQNKICKDGGQEEQMSADEWREVFRQAEEMGVSFILLAGGEPLMRRDVVDIAGEFPKIMFPVFTNGTLLDEEYLRLFDKKRNLLLVFSIEGGEKQTDTRRGTGVYHKLETDMAIAKKRHLIFGASITVTVNNLPEVTDAAFICGLENSGCKAVFYVEFVPVNADGRKLALDENGRAQLRKKIQILREQHPNMLFLSFPGDEKSSGGCLAAGRGFFHINAKGGAEPCPFSPYSDRNVREYSLREAMKSPLFGALQENGVLLEDHAGGCVLFEKKDVVEKIVADGSHEERLKKSS